MAIPLQAPRTLGGRGLAPSGPFRHNCRPRRSRCTPRATAAAFVQLPGADNQPSTSGSDWLPRYPSASHPRSHAAAPAGEDLGWRVGFGQHYVKGHCLGQGSFGTVYQGVNLHTGAEVAVKVMTKTRGKLSKDATLEKICREVDFLERLQGGRGIVDLQDCFEEQHEVLVVTELCAGGDLQRLADSHPVISERCLALIAMEVLRVIKTCNDHGVIHGDIKPANFVLKHPHRNPLYSTDPALLAMPWLKVIDFGCSQLLPGQHHEKLSKRAGTPVFMAPEIFARSYGHEADVWSAGVLLYQIFCKRFPFWDSYEAAKASRIDDIAEAVCHSDIKLDFGPWRTMSPLGREFITGLLTRDVKQRLSVQQALAHPWLELAVRVPAPTPAAAVVAAVARVGNNIVRSPAVQRAHVAQAA